MDVQPKRFIVVPRDAYDCLMNRHEDVDAAITLAEEMVGETMSTHYVLELKAVASRENPPVRVKRFK